MKTVFLAAVILFFLLGCTQVQDSTGSIAGTDSMEKSPVAMEDKSANPAINTAGKSEYKPFTKAGYDAARSSGKIIFLEFYASWCPTCQKQKPELESAFSQLNNGTVIGFQVNYNDSDTDEDEKNLARKFGVSYQHTHVLIDSMENKLVPNSNLQLSRDEVIAFINSGVGA